MAYRLPNPVKKKISLMINIYHPTNIKKGIYKKKTVSTL